MTVLGTAALDDGSAGPGPHTGTEAMLALAAADVRLIGTFHNEKNPDRRSSGSETEYEPPEALVKGECHLGSPPTPENLSTAKSSSSPRKKELGPIRPLWRFRGSSGLNPTPTISLVAQCFYAF